MRVIECTMRLLHGAVQEASTIAEPDERPWMYELRGLIMALREGNFVSARDCLHMMELIHNRLPKK